MEENDPSELHICPKCKAFFATKDFLRDHMKRNCVRLKSTEEFTCKHCDGKFKTKYQMNRHSLTHSSDGVERPFKCHYCEKTFLTKAHLKRHNVVHLPKDEVIHTCNECGKAFAWPSELKSHLKSHAGEKRFKCGICGKMFFYLTSLKSHIDNRHMFNGKLICVVCKSSFNEATELIIHMKTHSENHSLQCERCYALFTSLRDLETHICINFGGNPLVCVTCLGEFETTQDYCKHNCLKTSSNRKCGCCLKVFKSLWHLREHLITHTGEKPYVCTQCKSLFRRKRELDIHLTRHSDNKPFTCQYCNEKFSSDTYLKQHQRKEHRAKKFMCPICKHNFMHRCALTNHVRFHKQTGNTEFGKKHHRKKVVDSEKDNISADDNQRENPILIDTIPAVIQDMTFSNSESPRNTTTIFEKGVDGNLILRCASCLLCFESHSSLLRHRKENHSDGKSYQCPQCSKTFSVAANLTQHQKTHNAPPSKYTCATCGKGYNVTHKLRDHLKTKHCRDTQNITDLELESGTITLPESLVLEKDYSKSYKDLETFIFPSKLSELTTEDTDVLNNKIIDDDSVDSNSQAKNDCTDTFFVDL